MKSQFAVTVALLAAALAAPTATFAEDVVSSDAIREAADQARYDKATAKRAAKIQLSAFVGQQSASAESRDWAADREAQRRMEEASRSR